MKKLFMLAILTMFVGVGFAQKDKNVNFAERQKEMTAKRAAQLIKNMKLTDEDEDWFTQLYTEYQDSLFALRMSLRPHSQPEEVNGMKEMKQFTDEEATKMLENQFQMEEKQVSVKRAYYAKFKERLTPKQMMLVFMGPPMNLRGKDNNQNQMPMPPHPMPGFGGWGGGWHGR